MIFSFRHSNVSCHHGFVCYSICKIIDINILKLLDISVYGVAVCHTNIAAPILEVLAYCK